MIRRPLATKFLAVLLPLGLTGVVGHGVLTYHQTKAQMERRVEERAGQVAALLSSIAENSSTSSDLQRIVDAIAAERDIEHVVITRSRVGPIVAASDASWLGRTPEEFDPAWDADLRAATETQRVSARFDADKSIHEVTTPVAWPTELGVERFGAVRVAFDTRAEMAAIRAEARRQALELGLATLVLAVVVILLVWRLVLRNAREIAGTLQRQRAGDRGARAAPLGDDELGELARSLNGVLDLRDRAEAQLEVAKADSERFAHSRVAFLAKVSHELRTPLTAIKGFAEQLRLDDLDAAQWDRAVRAVADSSTYLVSLVDDLLDASRLEEGRMPLDRVSFQVEEVLQDVLRLLGPMAARKGLALEVACELPTGSVVEGDPVRLKQILVNLVGNAIKFTERGGVWLTARRPEPDGPLQLRVVDSGPGLAVDQRSRLFGLFEQAEARPVRRGGGAGLGLFISRGLAQLMGGDIELQSEVGAGSSFLVRLPLPAVDGPPRWRPEPRVGVRAAPQPAGVRLLVAEDMEDLRDLYRNLLGVAGYEYTLAASGPEALASADGTYAGFLIDMHMPGMDGVETLHALRARGLDQPAVILTASLMPDEIEGYRQAGFAACVGKPLDREQFFTTLARLFAARQEPTQPPALADALAEVRSRFVGGLRGRAARMTSALAARDWGQLADEAHKLKGAGGSFGFPAISEAASRVEDDAVRGDADASQRDLVRLEAVIVATPGGPSGPPLADEQAATG